MRSHCRILIDICSICTATIRHGSKSYGFRWRLMVRWQKNTISTCKSSIATHVAPTSITEPRSRVLFISDHPSFGHFVRLRQKSFHLRTAQKSRRIQDGRQVPMPLAKQAHLRSYACICRLVGLLIRLPSIFEYLAKLKPDDQY